jgi:hypothetical protein
MAPKRLDLRIETAISELFDLGFDPPQVTAELKRRASSGAIPHEPDPKTVRSRFKERTFGDAWTLGLDESESGVGAGQALDALAELINQTDGRTLSLSAEEARIASQIRDARPELPLWVCLRLAREYASRRGEQRPTQPIDLLVALAPWRGAQEFRTFAAISSADVGEDLIGLAWRFIGFEFARFNPKLRVIGASEVEKFEEFASQLAHAVNEEDMRVAATEDPWPAGENSTVSKKAKGGG